MYQSQRLQQINKYFKQMKYAKEMAHKSRGKRRHRGEYV